MYMEPVIEPNMFRQVGIPAPEDPHQRTEYFELVLNDLASRIGRPTPEVRGYHLTGPEQSERTWRVVCTVRGHQVAPCYHTPLFPLVCFVPG